MRTLKAAVMLKAFALSFLMIPMALAGESGPDPFLDMDNPDVVPAPSWIESTDRERLFSNLPQELRYSSADTRSFAERTADVWDRIFERGSRDELREQLREDRLIPEHLRSDDSVFDGAIAARFISGPNPSDYAFVMTQRLLGSPATRALSNIRDDVGEPQDNFATGVTYMVHLVCYIAMVFCSFFIGYIFIAGMIKSTKDGQFMGEWDSTFVTLRAGMGAVGIIPLPDYGGLSLSQVLVLTAFLMGIGAGSTVMSLMARELMANPIVAASKDRDAVHDLARGIIDIQICGLTQHQLSQTLPDPLSATLIRSERATEKSRLFRREPQYNRSISFMFNARSPRDCGTIDLEFPASIVNDDGNLDLNRDDNTGIRASLSFRNDSRLTNYTQDGFITNYFKMGIGYGLTAPNGPIADLWFDLLPLSKLAVGRDIYPAEIAALRGADVKERDLTIPDILDIAPMTYWHAVDRYQMAVNDLVSEVASQPEMQAQVEELYELVDELGMMFGGAYYFFITRQQNAMAQAVEGSHPSVNPPDITRLTSSSWYADFARQLIRRTRWLSNPEHDAASLYDAVIAVNDIIDSAGGNSRTPSAALNAYNETSSGDTVIGQTIGRFNEKLMDGMQSIPRLGENTSRINPDPLLEIHSLGGQVIKAAYAITAARAASRFFGDDKKQGSDASTQSGMITSILMAMMISGLITIGVLYSAVIPALPWVMFSISALGLFTYLLMALVAAPLWWVQHTHPKGEDLVGQAGAGWKLLAGLYLRPPLMVMGLIGAMALMRIFGTFLNEMIGPTVTVMNDGITGAGLINQIALYGIVMLVVVYKTYALIYELQQTVMNWIGVGDSYTDFGEGQAQMKVVGLGAMAAGKAEQGMAGSKR